MTARVTAYYICQSDLSCDALANPQTSDPDSSTCAKGFQRTSTLESLNQKPFTSNMPMMLDHPVEQPNTRPEGSPKGRQTCGHLQQQATKCGHIIHPSAPAHTPLCPACLTSQIKSRMDLALIGLIAEGGLFPADCMRDRRWQRSKLRYEIANARQTKARIRDQLRVEREQAWEDAHQGSTSNQATATLGVPEDCPVCASMIAYQSTTLPETEVAKDVAWWERPGALVADHVLVPRTPLRPVRAHKAESRPQGSSALKMLVQNFRRAMAASDAHRRAWELRYRTESAVRRKHSLGQEFHFEPEFWDAPISAYVSRRNYRHSKDEQRMAARRARGNTTRPRPPRSSLSYSAHTDEVEINDETLEEMEKREESEKLERMARKVGEEVGYLYFIGDVDGLLHWREDYLRSDRQLVYKKAVPETKTEEPHSDSAEAGSDDEDDEDTSDEEENYEDDEENDADGENYDEMDVDGQLSDTM
ncbi:hypothetical protein CC86DRAFT_458611 [Ophiobolus disseminans]|uniref:Uncharacterized protein n=1 Tax=Ophiobolus disseminans TaxID=1469910 RepID=A0A6A6ZLX5_9PLEO|nr:hypothetical protein CC86DRAFT_458611 [Ophiobolus disseminans]